MGVLPTARHRLEPEIPRVELPSRRRLRSHKVMFFQSCLVLGLALFQQNRQPQRAFADASTVDHTASGTAVPSTRLDASHLVNRDTAGTAFASSVEARKEAFRENTEEVESKTQSFHRRKDVIIVNAVDGTVAGLSKATGELLWKRSGNVHLTEDSTRSGIFPRYEQHQEKSRDQQHHRESEAPTSRLLDPLVATTTTTTQTSSTTTTTAGRTMAVPSIDGHVYLTATSVNDEIDVTVTTNVADLVARSPFVDNRGSVYTGTRESIVFAIDGDTGQILQAMSVATPHAMAEYSNDLTRKDRNIVWMGRVDHIVSIHDPRSGHVDVQFRTAELQSVNDMMLIETGTGENNIHNSNDQIERRPPVSTQDFDDINDDQTTEQEGKMQTSTSIDPQRFWRMQTATGSQSGSNHDTLSVVATPNGNVALRDTETGLITWLATETFDAPIAFAIDTATGRSLRVDIVPDAVSPHGSVEYVSQEIARQLELVRNGGDHKNSSPSDGDDLPLQPIVGSLKHGGQLFAMPLAGRGSQTIQSPTAVIHRPSLAATASSSSSSSSAAAAGASTASFSSHSQSKHHGTIVSQISARQHSNLQYEQHRSKTIKKSCAAGGPNFPSCLVGGSGRYLSNDPFARGPGGSFLSEAAPHVDEHAIVPFYHPSFGYVSPEQFYNLNQNQQQDGRQYRRLLKILGWWFPPTLIGLFLLSFELGRRRRHKEKELVNDEVHSNTSSGPTTVGIIQVQDDVILGYGGHGTVVYKGMLEGRQVAVKRMLKAYHASADREISLLIESDGHPNVVRYFLKEIRGDFVYLALELCDLSLHDLIGTLRNRFDQTPHKEMIYAASCSALCATRNVLLQISSGIKHLHHLRIVHRDLKPANILLADAKVGKRKRSGRSMTSVFDIFEHGDYIAKISDMGLGKQLMGQSSYGASALGEVSLRGQSNGGQPSITGAGPGSVGWQAPEVMALRLPSDASVRSDGSSALNESYPDISSLDVNPNARTSRSVDIFSLGCIFYSMLIPGSHPFGEWYEREANIMHNRPNTRALKELSVDAHDLVQRMIQRIPSSRPTAKQVCEHHFFWNAQRRLLFLCDFSDRLETEGMMGEESSSPFLTKMLAIESNASSVVGTAWDSTLDSELVNNVQRFRTYDPSSIRDLLRLIRNKHHHFDELPERLRLEMGSNTDGLMNYFDRKFPKLLAHCFNICRSLFPLNDSFAMKYDVTPLSQCTIYQDERSSCIIEENTKLTSAEDSDATPAVGSSNGTDSTQVSIREDKVAEAPIVTNGIKPDLEGEEPTTFVGLQSKPELASVTDVGSEGPSGQEIETVVVWEGSTAAKAFNCRGWSRSDGEWTRRADLSLRKRDTNLVRCAEDPKFRTRLCNHWDASMGTVCPMKTKNKCVFAHGPVELRVKEAKRNRWGKLVDQNGDAKNPKHSGGEDTYGAATTIETERKQEGKWNTGKTSHNAKRSTGARRNKTT